MSKYFVKLFIESKNDDIAKSIKFEDTEHFSEFQTLEEAEEYLRKDIYETLEKIKQDYTPEISADGKSIIVKYDDDRTDILNWVIQDVKKAKSLLDKIKELIIENNGKYSNSQLESQLEKLINVAHAKGQTAANNIWLDAIECGCLEEHLSSFK